MRQRRGSHWEERKRIVFPRQGTIDLLSRQINDFWGDNEKTLKTQAKFRKHPSDQICNLLQFAKVTLSAGFLVRQYIKDSLYDRISTRPFLTPIEKKWIAFQILLGVQQV